MASPTFFFLILAIWTTFLAFEVKQTVLSFYHSMALDDAKHGMVEFVDDDENFFITQMSFGLKMWITVTVFLPRLIIAVILWFVGARWLTATSGFENLVLNALALTFICELDELLYRTCIPQAQKACLETTKLPLPSFTFTPTACTPIETVATWLCCVALTIVYIYRFQDAVPGYRWDLPEFCAKEAVHSLSSAPHHSFI